MPALAEAVEKLLATWSEEEFIERIPHLRLAFADLTPREAEVLAWVAQGKSNYEIGVILKACTGTICKHVEHILAKLSVENRTAAAAIAIGALANAKK